MGRCPAHFSFTLLDVPRPPPSAPLTATPRCAHETHARTPPPPEPPAPPPRASPHPAIICTTHHSAILHTHHFLTPPHSLARTINPQEKKQLEDDPLDNATAGPDGTATLPPSPPPHPDPRRNPAQALLSSARRVKRLVHSRPPLVHHSPPLARARIHFIFASFAWFALCSPFHLLPPCRTRAVVLAPARSPRFRRDARAPSSSPVSARRVEHFGVDGDDHGPRGHPLRRGRLQR